MSGAPADLQWEDAPRRRRGEEPRRKLAGWVVVAAALGVAASLALFLTSPRERGELLDAVPRELAGRWVTTDPRYADREFLIERDRLDLTLDLGPGGRARYPVVSVRSWQERDRRGYRVHYGTGDEARVMEVYVLRDGTLRLKNPPDVVWKRAP